MKVPRFISGVAAVLATLSGPAHTAPGTMDEITVRDENFEMLSVINNPGLLAKAQEQWDSLVRIKELPNTNWTHKIDIRSGSRSLNGRWLYNKAGYIAKLNYQLKPMYKVSDVKVFNEIYLGS